jgi:nuclear cap-binding protein subunit 1
MERRDYNKGGPRKYQDDRDRRENWGRKDDRGPSKYQKTTPQPQQPIIPKTRTQSIQELVVRIGDSQTPPLEKCIEGLSGALGKDLAKHKVFILDIIFKCVLALPTKTSIYATLVSLLNVSNPEIGEEILARINDEITVSLKRNESYNLKYLTRFLCELANAHVVEVESVFDLFELYLSEDSASQGRRDFFLVLMMSAIPTCGHLFNKSNSTRLGNLFNLLAVKTSNRNQEMNACVSIFTREDVEPVSLVNRLYDALSEHSKQGWPAISVVHVPWKHFEEKLTQGKLHPLIPQNSEKKTQTMELPSESNNVYPVYPCTFRLLENVSHKLWKDRKISDLERYIIEDYVADIIHFFSDSPKDCLQHLLRIPYKPKIDNILDIVTEALFSQLFKIPESDFPRAYYSLILIELSKEKPEAMQGILAKCVVNIYERLEELDTECFVIFTEWFAHYLSNFDFKWVWTQWAQPKTKHTAIQQNFLSQLFTRCIRLSYYERIERAIPHELSEKYFPSKSRPDFKFLKGASIPGFKAAKRVYVKIKDEPTPEQLLEWLDSPEASVVNEQPPSVIADIIVSCLLQISVKSLSVLYNNIAKYKPVLSKYITNLEAEKQAVLSISEFWQFNSQNIVIGVQKFHSSKIVSATAIAEWVFLASNFKYFTQHWIWEILYYAVSKSISEVAILQKTVNELAEVVDKPTATEEEKVQYKEADEKCTTEVENQKNLLLAIFENFESVLRSHINILNTQGNGDASSEDMDDEKEEKFREDKVIPGYEYLNPFWLSVTLGHFKSLGRTHFRELQPLSRTLDVLFTDSDPRITSNYEQIKSLVVNF